MKKDLVNLRNNTTGTNFLNILASRLYMYPLFLYLEFLGLLSRLEFYPRERNYGGMKERWAFQTRKLGKGAK